MLTVAAPTVDNYKKQAVESFEFPRAAQLRAMTADEVREDAVTSLEFLGGQGVWQQGARAIPSIRMQLKDGFVSKVFGSAVLGNFVLCDENFMARVCLDMQIGRIRVTTGYGGFLTTMQFYDKNDLLIERVGN
jgi:hypothetical protein